MNIRFASETDSPVLRKIYAGYIDTPITFECAVPTVQEFAERIQKIGKEYPYLVCEQDGRIIGYAYAHKHMERAAYQWNAELSVYLEAAFTSKGLGRKLYALLIKILKLQGIKTAYARVTVPNIKSEKLHESLGFTRFGTLHNTGYKCGRWHDVACFAKQLASYEYNPAPPVSINKLPKKKLEKILSEKFLDFPK